MTEQKDELTQTRIYFLVATALLIGVALRLLFLGSKSLWLDEALSLRLAADPQRLFANGYEGVHPPLFYLLLYYWMPLGTSEFMLRLLSVVFGSAAILAGYALALEVGGPRVALTTIWLLALSPLLVWYAQELRNYSLLLFWGLLSSLALVRLVTRPKFGWWLLFVIAMSGAIYTHYEALLLIAVQIGLIGLLHIQKKVRRLGVLLWLASWPVVILLYWPWLVTPGMRDFAREVSTADYWQVGIIVSLLSIPWVRMVAGLAALFAIFVAFLITYGVVRRKFNNWDYWLLSPAVRMSALLLFVALAIFSVIPRLYTLKKMLVQVWPYGLLVVAWIFPWRVSNRVPLILIMTTALIGSLVNVTWIPKDQWREMATYLVAHGAPTDSLWVLPAYQVVPLNYYFAHPGDDELALSSPPNFSAAHVTPTMSDDRLAKILNEGQRVWFINHLSDSRKNDPDDRLERWLKAHMVVSDQIHLFGIDATLYSPPP